MAIDFHDILLSFANNITSEDTRNRFLKRVGLLDQKKYRDIIYGVKLVQRGEAKVTRVAKPLMMQAPSRYPVLEDDFEEEEE